MRLLRAEGQQLMHQCGQMAGVIGLGIALLAASTTATLAGIHIAGRITTR